MKQKRVFCILGSVVWFGIAAAVLINEHREQVALEAELEENRNWNRNHPDYGEGFLEWSHLKPVHPLVVLLLIVAGLLTAFGRWQVGCLLGALASVTTAWTLWTRYHP
jgi:hypothetical protein